MTLAGIAGLFFLTQFVLITIVIFILRAVLERKLIENTMKEFQMYSPMENFPSELWVMSYGNLAQSHKDELQKLAVKKFGIKVQINYSVDKALMGGMIVKTKDIKIGHSLRERLKEGGIVK